MAKSEIISFLKYWEAAKMVALEEIRAFDQVHQARKFCACMRQGVFTPDCVTDLQIWNALREMRKNASKAKGT